MSLNAPLRQGETLISRRAFPMLAAMTLSLLVFPAAQAGNPALIKINTNSATPLAPGFSGFNAAQPKNGVEYYDPKFLAAVAPLKPGWVRYPGGTVSMAFDWNPANPYGGHINIDWMNSLITGNPPAVTGQPASILALSQQLTQTKGGVSLSDFADFVHALGASAIICFNVFTDNNPDSATQMALAAQSLGLNVLAWELGNEPYLYPVVYPTPGSPQPNPALYASDVYSPYYLDLTAGAPSATVALAYAGLYTGASVPTSNWDPGLAAYTPHYWNAATTHIYPVTQVQSTQNLMLALNGILAYGSSEYITSYLVPFVGPDTPIYVTEFNAGLPPNTKFLGYLYNGIFLAEYVARLSAVPNVKAVGVHALYTDNGDYHGLVQSVDDYEAYLLGQYALNNEFSTDTATDPNTPYQFYMSAPGEAMAVANQAINSSAATWRTVVTGGATVPISGFDGQPIPAIFAQAYQANDGSHYLLVFNKSGQGQNATIVLNGAKVTSPLNLTYVWDSSPTAMNTGTVPYAVRIQTGTSANPVFLHAYSVTCIQW
ncbi:MAG TPA: hypothetical protein VMI94_06490 [Bryobacteraceae bacterium]|nr:hypothetical protein [Bryobacteraceae bacterium]